MWCAIQVTGNDGQSRWLSNPDLGGRRSVGTLDNAAAFWRTKHAETAMGLYIQQQNAGSSEIRIVDVGDKILGEVPTAS
jgi:hypothetical protein